MLRFCLLQCVLFIASLSKSTATTVRTTQVYAAFLRPAWMVHLRITVQRGFGHCLYTLIEFNLCKLLWWAQFPTAFSPETEELSEFPGTTADIAKHETSRVQNLNIQDGSVSVLSIPTVGVGSWGVTVFICFHFTVLLAIKSFSLASALRESWEWHREMQPAWHRVPFQEGMWAIGEIGKKKDLFSSIPADPSGQELNNFWQPMDCALVYHCLLVSPGANKIQRELKLSLCWCLWTMAQVSKSLLVWAKSGRLFPVAITCSQYSN